MGNTLNEIFLPSRLPLETETRNKNIHEWLILHQYFGSKRVVPTCACVFNHPIARSGNPSPIHSHLSTTTYSGVRRRRRNRIDVILMSASIPFPPSFYVAACWGSNSLKWRTAGGHLIPRPSVVELWNWIRRKKICLNPCPLFICSPKRNVFKLWQIWVYVYGFAGKEIAINAELFCVSELHFASISRHTSKFCSIQYEGVSKFCRSRPICSGLATTWARSQNKPKKGTIIIIVALPPKVGNYFLGIGSCESTTTETSADFDSLRNHEEIGKSPEQ